MSEPSKSEVFLSPEDVAILTGVKLKTKQIEQLRKMGLAFWVNARGIPVVARASVEGRRDVPPPKKTWEMPPR